MGQSVSSNEKQQLQQVICRSRKWHCPEDLTLHLPDECLAIVFAKLGCQDRNASSLVCKRWRLIDSNSRHRLVLLARSHLSPFLSTLLYSRFSSVSVLSLKCSRRFASIDDNAFSCIPTFLTRLKKLKLKGCVNISDEGLHAFSLHKPIHLIKLTFASCSFGPRGVNSILSNCPTLRDLTLKRLRKLDAQTTPLSITNSTLTRLCLKDLHNARLFASLLCAPKALKTLIICRSSGNWDRIFSESLKCRLLTEVQLENVQLGDAGLTSISAASPDLEILYLSRVSDCTDVGFSAAVTCCRKLRKLHIDACSRFSAINKSISISSLANSCPRLQELVLMGIPITIASLNVLASNCSSLERMAVCNTDSMGDPELRIVAANFSALKKLCIKNCSISDAGIEAIAFGCPNLIKLKVKRCRGVTQASVCQLRFQRRSLIVSMDDAGALPLEEAADSHRTSSSTMTHIVCSSRSASLIKSKLGTALQRRKSVTII